MPNNEEDQNSTPQQAPRWLTIRDRPEQLTRILLGCGCIALVLGIWFFLTAGERAEDRIVAPVVLPSVTETAGSFPSLWKDRALSRSASISIARVLSGFLLAAAIGVPLGVIAACYPRVDAFLKPLTTFGRSVPVVTLVPLTILWFGGVGETQKVLFIFIACIAFVLFDAVRSVNAISNSYLDTAYTLGARRDIKGGARRAAILALIYGVVFGLASYWMTGGYLTGAVIGVVVGFLLWLPVYSHQAIGKVLFPLALPEIANSLRLLFGLGFGYIVLAEVIGQTRGLGQIIAVSQRLDKKEHVYLILIVITLIAFTIDRAAYWLQRRLFPYVQNG